MPHTLVYMAYLIQRGQGAVYKGMVLEHEGNLFLFSDVYDWACAHRLLWETGGMCTLPVSSTQTISSKTVL